MKMDEAVIVIDKTVGPSSFDIVREVRRHVKIKKVGHAGTLDPFATGVLVLLTGRATKLSNALLNADKRYEALIKLGEATDSMDCTGAVVENSPIPELTLATVSAVLKSFEGEWNQIPPMYSAKKIQGVRLYELARKNITVKRESIPVQLFEVKLISLEKGSIRFEVHCSKGTYIRSLGDEIARRLGTVGHLTELRRLSCGGFSINESLTVESLVSGGSDWQAAGYRNYVRLLSSEGLVRRAAQNRRGLENDTDMPQGSLIQGLNRENTIPVSTHLPRRINSDNHLLN